MDRPGGELVGAYALIVQEIRKASQGRIPFSRFMELALYHPTEGYYMKGHPKLGKSGDFFTNAHVGSVFGQTLCRRFLKWVPEGQTPWALIEMGAGDGRLMEQVCVEMMEAEVDPDSVHVYLIETSSYHRQLQQERLRNLPFLIKWVERVSDVPSYSFGIVYSNELVDAFPVHRIKRVSEEEIVEIYVTVDPQTQQLVETYGPILDFQIELFLKQFGFHLNVGQLMEVNLLAKKWLEEIGGWIENGYLLTIDYGGLTRELLSRREGTLRFYHKHTMPQSPYVNPGEVDITCHVNFESLQMWGREAGLETIFFSTQSHFLLQSGILDTLSDNHGEDPFSGEAKKKRAIQQLIHPDAMGEAFHVLLQRKEVES